MDAPIRLAATHRRGKVEIELQLVLRQVFAAGINLRDGRRRAGLGLGQLEMLADVRVGRSAARHAAPVEHHPVAHARTQRIAGLEAQQTLDHVHVARHRRRVGRVAHEHFQQTRTLRRVPSAHGLALFAVEPQHVEHRGLDGGLRQQDLRRLGDLGLLDASPWLVATAARQQQQAHQPPVTWTKPAHVGIELVGAREHGRPELSSRPCVSKSHRPVCFVPPTAARSRAGSSRRWPTDPGPRRGSCRAGRVERRP